MNQGNVNLFNQSLSTLSGVGNKTLVNFARLNIHTLKDLILYIPYARSVKETYQANTTIDYDKTYIIKLTVTKIDYNPRNQNTIIHTLSEDGKKIEVVFFKFRPYHIINRIQMEHEYLFIGKLKLFHNNLTLAHPEFCLITQAKLINLTEPKYHLTYGITNQLIQKLVQKALLKLADEEEWIPYLILKNHKWPSFLEALNILHFLTPYDNKSYNLAHERLSFDEILSRQQMLKKIRMEQHKTKAHTININNELLSKVLNNLPFKLTAEQQKVLNEIFEDLKSPNIMLRLVQGDVGSGKTIVALIAMLVMVDNGFQAALLVPTDILATQHFENISKITNALGIKTIILKNSLKAREKKEALEEIASGNAKIIIGTHSIIQQNVAFHNLKLAVIDEQHRFGVMQRTELINKCQDVETILMSATPIPRTMLMATLGDIDVSSILTKPAGRKEIITTTFSQEKVPDIIKSLKNILAKKQKIYWVCPLIEESEEQEHDDNLKMMSATKRYEYLQKYFPEQVTILHGKLTQEEKQTNMQAFAESAQINILVATTVIEVGVDVKSSTLIIIENAERFGLAQLHQLRGRVGRNDLQSFCILIYGDKFSQVAKERLKIMKNSNDGFYIAEQDFLLRGGGDIIGLNQSGDEIFKIAEFPKHQELLNLAYNLAKQEQTITNVSALTFIFTKNNVNNLA
ncbi:ATP-dependent DNA helicase RecG [Rickettsiales endosymbiont of Stachyamoeba lipophora]|uniref:ATP-dependent DNA helicase RecG n=1 Tax=Rickettsiales endosymbiont of Stachyamoeba lipophora TaxID=2486578 RepID=UPI000F64F35E|nr:ATP-dependent DNA helicase RecG [Rickettsiales endosymbiont of Stachyamoeba lipophora]AZL15169.1 ATP-dependent DNA helicase RecG [Rickettsiales endosymbiont of Stachyamoeba lipophora]